MRNTEFFLPEVDVYKVSLIGYKVHIYDFGSFETMIDGFKKKKGIITVPYEYFHICHKKKD